MQTSLCTAVALETAHLQSKACNSVDFQQRVLLWQGAPAGLERPGALVHQQGWKAIDTIAHCNILSWTRAGWKSYVSYGAVFFKSSCKQGLEPYGVIPHAVTRWITKLALWVTTLWSESKPSEPQLEPPTVLAMAKLVTHALLYCGNILGSLAGAAEQCYSNMAVVIRSQKAGGGSQQTDDDKWGSVDACQQPPAAQQAEWSRPGREGLSRCKCACHVRGGGGGQHMGGLRLCYMQHALVQATQSSCIAFTFSFRGQVRA